MVVRSVSSRFTNNHNNLDNQNKNHKNLISHNNHTHSTHDNTKNNTTHQTTIIVHGCTDLLRKPSAWLVLSSFSVHFICVASVASRQQHNSNDCYFCPCCGWEFCTASVPPALVISARHLLLSWRAAAAPITQECPVWSARYYSSSSRDRFWRPCRVLLLLLCGTEERAPARREATMSMETVMPRTWPQPGSGSGVESPGDVGSHSWVFLWPPDPGQWMDL